MRNLLPEEAEERVLYPSGDSGKSNDNHFTIVSFAQFPVQNKAIRFLTIHN